MPPPHVSVHVIFPVGTKTANGARIGLLAGVNPSVQGDTPPHPEALAANVTRVGPLASVVHVVDLEVIFLGETRETYFANKRLRHDRSLATRSSLFVSI